MQNVQKFKKIGVFAMLLVMTFALTGCTPGGGSYSPDNPAGFFWGIWHGWIAPISLVLGFFSSGVRIYEVNNTGWLYDLAFYMAVISGFGGLKLARKKDKK